ncbi:unnamed protein product, partial [Mesorhabditis spiculigera]
VPPELPEVGSQHTYKRIVDVRCDASHVVLVPLLAYDPEESLHPRIFR